MKALATFLLLATLTASLSAAQDLPATSPAEVPASSLESMVAPFSQYAPSVASDGDSYFVVWADHRRGGAWSDIYGSRVSAEGEVLDPLGIPIATTSGLESVPTVAWTGSNYLVVWHWSDSPPYGSVVAKRVSREGIVLDASPCLIWAGMTDPWLISTTNGRHALVSVRSSATSLSLSITSELQLVRTTAHAPVAAVGSDGDRFIVVALRADPTPNSVDMELRATLLDREGLRLSDEILTRNAVAGTIGLASDGTGYVMAFSARTPEGKVITRVVMLDRDGRFSRDLIELPHRSVKMTWNGAHYLLVWQDATPTSGGVGPTMGLRLDGDGARIDSEPFVIRHTASAPALGVASARGRSLVVWQTRPDDWGQSDIVASVVDGANAEGERFISFSAPIQERPVVASSRTHHAVAWIDYRGEDPRTIRASIFDGVGKRVAEDLLIGTMPLDNNVALSSDGENFLAVWNENGIKATRFTVTGELLDAQPIELGASYRTPAVGWNGSAFLVAWYSSRGTPVAVRIRPNGTVLDSTPLQLASANSFYSGFAIASDGGDFLVVWTESEHACSITCPPYAGRRGIFGTRVDPNGVILDPQSIPIDNAVAQPKVAFAGGEYLVAWRSSGGVFVKRIRAEGVLRDFAPLQLAGSEARSVSLTATDDTFIAGIERAISDELTEVIGLGIRSLSTGELVVEPRFSFRSATVTTVIPGYPPGVLDSRFSAVGTSLVAVYSRPAAEAMGVKRVFLRRLNGNRRRAARR